MSKIFPLLILLFFVSFGGGFLVYGLHQIDRASRTADWPAVRGEILEAKVRTHRSDNKDTWSCRVKYAYEVEGRYYEGDRIAFGYTGSNNESMHSNLQKKLSRSKYVRVYYDPRNPAESTLATGIHRSAYLPVMFGALWLTFCGGIASLVMLGGTLKKLPQRLAKLNHRPIPSFH